MRAVLPVLVTALLTGCGVLGTGQQEHALVEGLTDQLGALEASVAATHRQLTALSRTQAQLVGRLDVQSHTMQGLSTRVEGLPERIETSCPPSRLPEAPRCEGQTVLRVPVVDNKMVLGEVERIWIDPPGVSMQARIDTGAARNAMRVEDLVEFERDGVRWARFHILTGDGELVEVERKVTSYTRAMRPADVAASRRPVVAMRIRLGDVLDTFEFTLTDRMPLKHHVVLGRNFLTDVALVDVGRRFVQPAYRPTEANSS